MKTNEVVMAWVGQAIHRAWRNQQLAATSFYRETWCYVIENQSDWDGRKYLRGCWSGNENEIQDQFKVTV